MRFSTSGIGGTFETCRLTLRMSVNRVRLEDISRGPKRAFDPEQTIVLTTCPVKIPAVKLERPLANALIESAQQT